jgi:hypothetical protein
MNLAKTLAIRRKIDFLRHLVVHEFCRRTAFERSEGQKLHCLSGLATSRSICSSSVYSPRSPSGDTRGSREQDLTVSRQEHFAFGR